MSIEKNVRIVKNFLAALGRRDKQGLLALSAEHIGWIIPGEDWRWLAHTAGTRD
jgi:ketosteroid isomerase-like protein